MRNSGLLLVTLLFALNCGLSAQDIPSLLHQKEADLNKRIAAMPASTLRGMGGPEFQVNERYQRVLSEIVGETENRINDAIAQYFLDHEARTNFEISYLNAYMRKLLAADDSEHLRKLLIGFPELLDNYDRMDCTLAYIPDGILIYIDLALKSFSLSAREKHLAHLREDFPKISTLEKDDVKFLASARHWYETNKRHVSINMIYVRGNGLQASPGGVPSEADIGLFVPKS